MNEEKHANLKEIAREIRLSIIRMLKEAKSGHPGGSLSCADLLTVLYFDQMNIQLRKIGIVLFSLKVMLLLYFMRP